MVSVVFEESIAETIDRYVTDPRLAEALFGQGVIGALAGPRDPGTASVKLMHRQGDLLGQGPVWGYVEGGMGRVSFALAQAAIEAGAVLAAGVPVAEICPGEGVRVESGELLRSRVVVSNADPKRTLSLLGGGRGAGRVSRADRGLAGALAGREAERGAEPPAALRSRRRLSSPTGRWSRSAPASTPRSEAFEACERGEPGIGLRRALLPDRLRRLGGAAGAPRDERLRPVRALPARAGELGRRAATRSAG